MIAARWSRIQSSTHPSAIIPMTASAPDKPIYWKQDLIERCTREVLSQVLASDSRPQHEDAVCDLIFEHPDARGILSATPENQAIVFEYISDLAELGSIAQTWRMGAGS